jgi:hypothetical protein
MAKQAEFMLTGPQIAHLARYYADGADLAVRGEFVHVQQPDGTHGCVVGGELDSEPGMAGSIGMTRSTFLRLPSHIPHTRALSSSFARKVKDG